MITTSIWAHVRKSIAALIVVVLGAGIFGNAAQAIADRLDRERQFEIPAQPLATALVQFSKQAEMQLVTSSTDVGSRETRGISGQVSIRHALESLLDRTGLTYSLVGENTVAIVQEGTPRTKLTDTVSAALEGPRSIHLAQVEDRSRSESMPTARSADSSAEREGSDIAGEFQEQVDLGEIVVTGTNIRGVYPTSSPLEIYTAEDIARTGATTTEQFIAKLPQNLGTRTQFAAGSTTTSGTFVQREGVSGIDLRGLGVGTTLTLLNGRRLGLASSGQQADISLIPVSAIGRVEVLTDGASAIYGSDAIGGVVNFVLRDDFEGAETRLNYGGVTSGGLDQANFTQTFGGHWSSGHAMASYDYMSVSPLKTTERSFAAPSGAGYLTPDDRRQSVIVTASQDLSDAMALDGDFVFSRRDVQNFFSLLTNPNPLNHISAASESETQQYFANLGLNGALGDSVHGSLLASYSDLDVASANATSTPNRPGPPPPTISVWDTSHRALDLTAMLDGTLFDLPAGALRFSVGGGYLEEKYQAARTAAGVLSGRDLGRTTTYAFGELLIPLIADSHNTPLIRRLELSLAARYTSYGDASTPPLTRDFGDKTSPKVGLLWAPVESLSLRGTYGESFRAPTLTEIDPLGASGSLRQPFMIGGSNATAMLVGGPSLDLGAETAESFTLGFDFKPVSRPAFRISATYFNVDYVDRIGAPNPLAARANPAAWPDLVYRPTSAAQIEALLASTPFDVNQTSISLTNVHQASLDLFALSNLWISDSRVRNLSLTKLDGFDFSVGDRLDTSWGEISLGAQLTRILDYREQATSTAPIITVVDTVLRPVDLRGRGFVGFTRGGLQSTASVNYVDDYSSPLSPGGGQQIKSWTTIDWNATYDFGRDTQREILAGVQLSVSVQNLFDQEPPFVGGVVSSIGFSNPQGFDPANANPVGRMVVVGISKVW